MLEEKLIDSKNLRIKNIYFAHYLTKEEINMLQTNVMSLVNKKFQANIEELSKNDWELHKKLIKEGVNPNKIAKIIRNDEIEKLQEISSQTNFDFNQTIEPSLYERCSFINQRNVTLIDYAAFFSSVKCFKYLLMNGSKIDNTGKYAIAGGNEEIIHLCEQNHSTFEDAYETAIMFHRNEIFYYLYEKKIKNPQTSYEQHFNFVPLAKNKIPKVQKRDDLEIECVKNNNYEILFFLEKEGFKDVNKILNNFARLGNLYLIKYFNIYNNISQSTFLESAFSNNIELIKYILDKGFNINETNNYVFNINLELI